jgi:hypothetical protein
LKLSVQTSLFKVYVSIKGDKPLLHRLALCLYVLKGNVKGCTCRNVNRTEKWLPPPLPFRNVYFCVKAKGSEGKSNVLPVL